VVAGGCPIWAVSGLEKDSPSLFCDCLSCAQAGVRPGIVVKMKDAFHVSVMTNTADALLHFVESFLVPLVMCCSS
jgi:hypothetical protein